jgi:cytochrome c-type biogenesis protein CcmH/NrfG
VYVRQKRLPDAIDAFTRGLAYEPTNLELLELLGTTQVYARRPVDAAHTFERMVDLAPRNPTYRRDLIGAWQAAGDGARATAAYGAARAAGFTDAQLVGAAR